MLRVELGEVLHEERGRHGLSLRELAGRARISATYLGEVERGLKEPSFDVLESLAAALGLSAAEVLRRLADRVDPPVPARTLGYSLRERARPARLPSVQALANQLSQEEIYAMARFGEFLLQARDPGDLPLAERQSPSALRS